MWNIIVWIFFGLVAGAIAKFIMPGAQGGGFLKTSILGVAGAFVGGFLGNVLLGLDSFSNEFSFTSMGVAVVGAILVMAIYGFLSKKK